MAQLIKGRYLGGYKKYTVDTVTELHRVLGQIAQETAQQIEQGALDIAKEVIREEIYGRPETEYYERTGEIEEAPTIVNRWRNAYGQGFQVALYSEHLTMRPFRVVGGHRYLPQHMGVSGQDVRDNIYTWLNDGFPIFNSDREYKATYFKEIIQDRIKAYIKMVTM